MLSLGLLSWRAHETLRKTLASYRSLLPLVDEAVIFFNSITAEDRSIANEFGFRAEGSQDNLGILGGTLSLVRCLHGDLVLLTQNDNPVNVAPDVLRERIDFGNRMLTSGTVDMVRLWNRYDPTFSDRSKYLRYWPEEGGSDGCKLKLRRLLRPFKAIRMAGRAYAALQDPSLHHPEIFTKIDDSCISDTRFINYSDQPYMAFREKVIELLEWADAHKRGSRTLNGRPVPEIIINGPYWRKQRLKIAITDGVFAHARYDDSFRPDNAAYNPVQIMRHIIQYRYDKSDFYIIFSFR
jgi:hypothetical protein